MMAGCFSPPGGGGGGGDPWGQEFDDERFYRMSARKFNKHMAEKRRRCRINTALERLKYIILHVMRRNPEHFDKMEKADILDLTVKFLKAIQKHQSLSAAPRSAASQSSQRSTPTSTGHSRPARAALNIYTDPEVTASTSASSDSTPHHQGKERLSVGLKCRSGNIPSAVVRAVQDCPSTSVSPRSRSDEGRADLGKCLDYRKRPAPIESEYFSPSKRSSMGGDMFPVKKARISATVSSAAGRAETDAEKEDEPKVTLGHNLEYRLHSAFHLHPRDSQWTPPTLFCPVPKRPHTSTSTSGVFPSIPFTSGVASTARGERPVTPEEVMFRKVGKATSPQPRLDVEKIDKSKTQELKIEIPGAQNETVPPLQPAAARGPDSPQYALPLPGLLTSQVWRPW